MSNNSAPFEILAAPFSLYWAPVGTAFPLIDAVPAVDWVLIGTSGPLNYAEDGVTVKHPQSTKTWRSVGSPGPRKVFRTEEDLMIALVLADMTLEQYAHALNQNTVTTVPPGGEAGYKKIGLSRGLAIATVSLLLRGVSPEEPGVGESLVRQYEIPYAQQVGSPEVVYRRDEPAALALEWAALVDPDASTPAEEFGRIIDQTDAAVS